MKKYSWTPLLAIMAASFFFLQGMILDGKVPDSADMFHRMPLDQWVENYTSQNSDMPQWYPHLFGGMPSYGGFIHAPADPLRKVFDTLNLGWGMRYWVHFIIAGVGMFCYLRRRLLSEISSLFGAISFSLSPYLFGLINAGHPAKMYAIAFIPLVMLFAEKVMDDRSIRSALGLALFTALQLWTKHIQIVYYTWMIIIFIFVWMLVKSLKGATFNLKTFMAQISLMISAIFVSGVLVADPYLPIYEFQIHSTRGTTSSLSQEREEKQGTSWDYATQWSYHPKETISLLYPYFFGLQNYPLRDLKSQAYWGFMPFTQSTHYMGLIVLALAVFGFLIGRERDRLIPMTVASAIILVIGFGKHFPLFYWPLFEYAPMFSRFRVPSMIYILLPFTFSVIASNSLNVLGKLIESGLSQKRQKKLIITMFTIVGISLLLVSLGPELLSFSKLGETARYQTAFLERLKTARTDLFQKGALLSLVLSSGMLATIWLSLRKSINIHAMGLILIGLMLLDFWIVNNEFIHLRSERSIRSSYTATEEVKFLQKNKGQHRIMPHEQFGTNWYAYFGLSTVGGYRPVKLRSYQDLLDSKALNSGVVQDMLNVKYIITNQPLPTERYQLVFQGERKVYENKHVLPKAWFVESTVSVGSMKESLKAILSPNFHPSTTAIVQNYNSSQSLSIGSVEITDYTENSISLTTFSKDDGFLVLSENYYGPGWEVTVDGKKSIIYRTNHVLRGIPIEGGKHKIIFSVNQSTFKTSRFISLIGFFLILGSGIVLYRSDIKVVVNEYLRKKRAH